MVGRLGVYVGLAIGVILRLFRREFGICTLRKADTLVLVRVC